MFEVGKLLLSSYGGVFAKKLKCSTKWNITLVTKCMNNIFTHLKTSLTWLSSSGPMPSPGMRVTVCRPPYFAGGGWNIDMPQIINCKCTEKKIKWTMYHCGYCFVAVEGYCYVIIKTLMVWMVDSWAILEGATYNVFSLMVEGGWTTGEAEEW